MSAVDFRAQLYRQYVTGFKAAAPALDGAALAGYWSWCDHKYRPLLAGLDRAGPVLELGCGAGNLLAYLRRLGFSRALGVDISEQQVRGCRQRGVAAIVADALPFLAACPNTFEAIIMVDVLEHFTKDELLLLAPRLRDALRPGGQLLVQTANGAGLFPRQVIYGDLTHMTILTPESLAQLLRPFGFGQLAFYETGPVPVGLRGRRDVLLWRAVKGAAGLVRRVETGKRQAVWTENFICCARLAPNQH